MFRPNMTEFSAPHLLVSLYCITGIFKVGNFQRELLKFRFLWRHEFFCSCQDFKCQIWKDEIIYLNFSTPCQRWSIWLQINIIDYHDYRIFSTPHQLFYSLIINFISTYFRFSWSYFFQESRICQCSASVFLKYFEIKFSIVSIFFSFRLMNIHLHDQIISDLDSLSATIYLFFPIL